MTAADLQAHASFVLRLFDQLLEPQLEVEDQIAELQAAKVSPEQIAALYPVAVADYARGIDHLRAAGILLSLDFRDFFALNHRLNHSAQQQVLNSTLVACKMPLALDCVALTRTLASAPADQILHHTSDTTELHQALSKMEVALRSLLRQRRAAQIRNLLHVRRPA